MSCKLNSSSEEVEKRVLIQFDEEIHCEIVNKDEEKRKNIENVVCNIIDKNVEVVGVPSRSMDEIRSEYINHRKQNDFIILLKVQKIILKRGNV